MVWTYTGTPLTVPLDEVRLLIGDTDTTDQQLQDGEIAYVQSKYSYNNIQAAAMCCKVLAAKYSRLVDSAIETIRISASQKLEHYLKLYEELWEEATRANAAPIPFVAGISISDIIANRGTNDRVLSVFRNNQFNNPLAGENNSTMDDDVFHD
jgi:hypothetical protein